jgi:hypothetical protein
MDGQALPAVKARYPLQEARIEVTETPSRPGVYRGRSSVLLGTGSNVSGQRDVYCTSLNAALFWSASTLNILSFAGLFTAPLPLYAVGSQGMKEMAIGTTGSAP